VSASGAITADRDSSTESADIGRLREITRTLIDASSVYGAAADEADDQAYATRIRELAGRRYHMANEFQAQVALLGGNPAEIGSPVGTAHRVVLEARQLGNADTRVAVEEALRGENYLLDQLTQGSEASDLTPQTRAFLARYIDGVRHDRDQLQAYAATL
jgi:uncharacterized protein (TIGR02284 family)